MSYGRTPMGKCVILGGNGFIGSHLAEALLQRGHEVVIFDHFRNGTKNITSILSEVTLKKGDFNNEHDIDDVLKGANHVFHFISTTNPATSFNEPVFDIETNLIGTIKLLQIAAQRDIERIIFPSSGGTIYGDTLGFPISETTAPKPSNPYAISKYAIERYLHFFHEHHHLDFLIVRYSNPYGERQNPNARQGVIPIFLNQIKQGKRPVIFGDGSAVRDYIYIRDAIDATLQILESNTEEKVYNVGSGQGTSLNELISIMSQVTGENISPVYVYDEKKYVSKIVLDISKLKKEIGWQPTTELTSGISRTWKWINTIID